MTDTTTTTDGRWIAAEPVDVLVLRSGELRPAITEPTVIGVVVRTPHGEDGAADAITFARTALPAGTDYTETLRVVITAPDGIEERETDR